MKNKQYLNEVRQLQKIAGLLNENPVKAHMEKLIQLAKTGNEKKENILAGFSGAGIHYKVTTADPNTIKYWNHEQGLSGEVKLKENAWHPDKDKINNDVKQLIVMSIRHFNGLAKQGDLTSDDFANGNLLGYMESFDDSADDDFDLTPEESSAFSSVWQNVMKKAKAEAAAGGLNTLKDYVSFLNKEAAGLGESKSDNLNEWDPDKDWDETDDEEEEDDNSMPSDEELWGTSRSKRR